MRWRLLAMTTLLAAACGAQDTQTLTPREDTEVVLHNPDMGWVLYENYPLDPRANGTATMSVLPEARFEGCDDVAIMFAWSDVETAEGRFDWTRVDAACDFWLARGKRLHLRISSEPLFGWSRLDPPGGLGIPDWLLARIPDDQKRRREDGASFGWHVDARNPLYQARLRQFLAAANAHFQGARTPALVDLRGFGRWGEWHTGYPYATLDDKRAALDAVLGIWSAAFPERWLALSYSYDPDGPASLWAGPTDKLDPAFTGEYDAYLRYSAFDLALARPNITLRRDGAGGAVHSNERRLCEHVYRDLRRAPQMSEFLGGYTAARAGGPAWVKWTVEDALSLHPNYIGLLGYGGRDAQDFMAERPDLIALGLRRMGYRLVPLSVTLPRTIQAGRPFPLIVRWVNRGVGRALRDATLRLRLTAAQGGRTLAQTDAGPLPTSRWLQDDEATTRTEVTFPTISANGAAVLSIGLRDPASGRPVCLPLVRRSHDEFGELGGVVVAP
ncbi:MAG: DUF4832 domain-containing protein [Armatimonadetes bacterium]|nr:DUF4832 domain-containing protein [Armatimonadota bacterium]